MKNVGDGEERTGVVGGGQGGVSTPGLMECALKRCIEKK